MDLGAARRGVDMGPSAVRIARLGEKLRELGYQVRDRGNVTVNVRESLEQDPGEAKARFVREIAQVNKSLSQSVQQVLTEGETPVVLGGDHSIAVGTVAGVSDFYRKQNKGIGIIWLDAHADINTPDTTPSGNVHGMPVAHIMGFGTPALLEVSSARPMVDPTKIVLIGLRDLDAGEKKTLKDRKVNVFTMRDMDELGMREVMRRAIEIASSGTAGFHVSFDMDWVDPSVAPGVGTPVAGGATYREAHLAMEMVSDSAKLLSMEVTEVNPILDHENRTAQLACEVILSAFGKRIL